MSLRKYTWVPSWSVTVSLTNQLHWVMACSDTWSNIILDVSIRVFKDEINI